MFRNLTHLPILLLLFLITACGEDDGGNSSNQVQGSGNIISETRTLSGFQQVNANNSITANITAGTDFRVEVSADDNAIDRIVTRVDGDVLVIQPESGTSFRNVQATVNVTMPVLQAARGDNSSVIGVSGFQDTTATLVLDATNSSTITGSGTTVKELVVDLSNSSRAELFGMSALSAGIVVSNSSKLDLAVSELIAGTVVNASTLRYRGEPTLDVQVIGDSEIVSDN